MNMQSSRIGEEPAAAACVDLPHSQKKVYAKPTFQLLDLGNTRDGVVAGSETNSNSCGGS